MVFLIFPFTTGFVCAAPHSFGETVRMKRSSTENMHETAQYAHVMLFACPHCARPLVVTCISSNKSLELAEAAWFSPTCHCGWTGDLAGITATRHWVEPWHGKRLAPGELGHCNEHMARTAGNLEI
jgi:hypothetical protein